MIVASFKDQFGTPLGTMLRQWCLHNKWALAWSLHSDSACLDARRLFDPLVLVRAVEVESGECVCPAACCRVVSCGHVVCVCVCFVARPITKLASR